MTRVKPENRKHKIRRRFKSDEERGAAEKERRKQWRTANPEKHRASYKRFLFRNPGAARRYYLARKYGLDENTINEILVIQEQACAICCSKSPGRAWGRSGAGEWVIDHDHRTNKVRGIICHPCNAALGMAKDSTRVLQSMIWYLEKSS